MFNWLKSSTLNFMLSFVNFILAIALNSALNGVICLFCFLMGMGLRRQEKGDINGK